MDRPDPDVTQLRQGALAVMVLDEVDLVVHDHGVSPAVAGRDSAGPGRTAPVLTWAQLATACGPWAPSSPAGRRRLGTLLQLTALIHAAGPDAAERLSAAAVLLALPPGHVDHLGAAWVQEQVPGQVLDLGVGLRADLVGAQGRNTPPIPLPPRVAQLVGVLPGSWWPRLRTHADRMAALALTRLRRDHNPKARTPRGALLRPVGGCDVLALLSRPAVRHALAAGDGTGMRAVAAPTRRRAWYDLGHVDPAFVTAAWQLTDEPLRGVGTALLVTRDAVSVPR